jgi:hypothetical protein
MAGLRARRPSGPLVAHPARPAPAQPGRTAHLLVRPGRGGVGRPVADAAGVRAGVAARPPPPGPQPAQLGGLRFPGARRMGQPAREPAGRGPAHPGRGRGGRRGDVVRGQLRPDRRSGRAGRPVVGPGCAGEPVRGLHRGVHRARPGDRRGRAPGPDPPGARVAALPVPRSPSARPPAPAELERRQGRRPVPHPARRLAPGGPAPLGTPDQRGSIALTASRTAPAR